MYSAFIMFIYHQLTIDLTVIYILIVLKISLCSPRNADEHYLVRLKRAIGGASLDTSNFVLYVDPSGSRFIEVPKEYIQNWLDDQKMWRTWSIILGIMCYIFFATFLIFIIYGFCTSTGPFVACIKHIKENSSEYTVTSSEVTIPMDYTLADNNSISQRTFLVGSQRISALQSSGQLLAEK